MQRPYSSKAIANEFIVIARDENVGDISQMKVQKLVYYAHAWFLAFFEQPLLADEIQAWRFGPVIPDLYHEFKEFGNEPISRLARELSVSQDGLQLVESRIPTTDQQANWIVREVWRVYGRATPIQLSNLTHEQGSPWHLVASQYSSELPHGITIPNELIRQVFVRKQAEQTL